MENFVTSDYYLAAYLVAASNGVIRPIGLIGNRPRARFVLRDPAPSLREDLAERYLLETNDEVPVSKVYAAMRQLRALLRDAG